MFKYNLIKLHEKLLFSLCMRHTLTVITCLFPWKQQKRHNDAIRESIFNDKILFFHIVIFANNEQEPAYFACWNIKKKKKDMHQWRKITCSYTLLFSLLTCITYHLTLLRSTIWSLNFQQVSMNVNQYNFFPHWHTSTFYALSCQMLLYFARLPVRCYQQHGKESMGYWWECSNYCCMTNIQL